MLNEEKNHDGNNLLFDFTVDKTAKKVFITREFDAGLPLVWDAFTKPEILDQCTRTLYSQNKIHAF